MNLSDTFSAFSTDRLWRVKELSDLRQLYLNANSKGEQETVSRSVVVLCYAHWEGYCAKLVNLILDKLEWDRTRFSQLPFAMRLGIVSNRIQSFSDRKDTTANRIQLISDVGYLSSKRIESFDRKILLPRSNLDFNKLQEIFSIIEADLSPFQKYRIKLDKEIVGWRHQVAHGEMFLLDKSDIYLHTQLCEELLFVLKDTLENWIATYGK